MRTGRLSSSYQPVPPVEKQVGGNNTHLAVTPGTGIVVATGNDGHHSFLHQSLQEQVQEQQHSPWRASKQEQQRPLSIRGDSTVREDEDNDDENMEDDTSHWRYGPSSPPHNSLHNNDSHDNSHSQSRTVAIAFLLMGLFNNASYVIMLASAKNMSEGGTAIVYICNILPGLLVKLSAPYWFDQVDYSIRIQIAAVCMGTAFCIVSYFSRTFTGTNDSNNDSSHTAAIHFALIGQLLGVALTSFQTALGEASLLALAGKYDSEHTVPSSHHQHEQEEQQSSLLRHGSDDNDNVNDNGGSGRCSLARRRVGEDATTDGVVPSPPPPTTTATSQTTTTKTKGVCLTAFSSGTGLAGPFGYAWKIICTEVFHMSLRSTIFLALSLAIAYGYIYHMYLYKISSHHESSNKPNAAERTNHANTTGPQQQPHHLQPYRDHDETNVPVQKYQPSATPIPAGSNVGDPYNEVNHLHTTIVVEEEEEEQPLGLVVNGTTDHGRVSQQPSPEQQPYCIDDLTLSERFGLVVSLWPYIIPLFTVYAAEYACQAGAWTAIGFPLTDQRARNHFYEISNWLYQAGVFVSRSSGTLIHDVGPAVLWTMPLLQVGNLIFFTLVGAGGQDTIWYNPALLYTLAFYAGLLGGAVYVHGYKHIVKTVPHWQTEFALASTSVAESFGILAADIAGLFLQACLYQRQGIPGSLVTCPS